MKKRILVLCVALIAVFAVFSAVGCASDTNTSVDFVAVRVAFETAGYTVPAPEDTYGTLTLTAELAATGDTPAQRFRLRRFTTQAVADAAWTALGAGGTVALPSGENRHRSGLYIWDGTATAVAIFAQFAPTEPATGCFGGHDWIMWVIMGVLVVAILVVPMFTRRKRGKQINDIRTTLRIGDEVMTAGGIVGSVVEIKEHSSTEKDFVLETGTEESGKSKLQFDIRALYENRTRIKELREEAAKQAEIARLEKEAKDAEKKNKTK